jgi:hypothetical protein
MDKQVFIQHLNMMNRRKILLIRIGMSLLFLTLCTFMWLTKSGISPRSMFIFKATATAFFAGLVFTFITMLQKMSRRLNLHCPSCNRNLSGPMSQRVLASDQCFQCGMRLF